MDWNNMDWSNMDWSNVSPENIDWNFGTYYLVGRHGKIKAYNGISPESLEKDIAAAIRGDMLGS